MSHYLYSLPERLVRSLSAIAGGAVQEISEIALPAHVRRSRLYDSLVDSSVRFLIEQVGQVEREQPGRRAPQPGFLLRRSAGNVVELAGYAAFRASPVWVLAALADLAGAGRDLIQAIAAELQKEGLLDPDQRFDNVGQLLDGLEKTSGRLAEAVNTPPLNVADLRREWRSLSAEAAAIPASLLPTTSQLWNQWRDLQQEARAQRRSVIELSSVMALAAIRALPERSRWLSSALLKGGRRTGELVAGGLLDHYRSSLREIHQAGYLAYWRREFAPYLAGALRQFSPARLSSTEKFLQRRGDRSQDTPPASIE